MTTNFKRTSAFIAGAIAGICSAELRSARRMVRTWLFAAIALGVGASLYEISGAYHFFDVHSVAPRFALPGLGFLILWILLIGLVFVTFDSRARDKNAGIAEALDARPIPNAALLAGRLLATTIIVWLPLWVLAAGLQIGGVVVARMQWPAGVAPEPVSLLTFVLLDAPVALIFWGALTTMLVALLRARWIAAAVALALLGLHFYALFNTPLHLLPALSGVANLGLPGSEILPRWPAATDLTARVATLVCAAGLLAVAAGVLPRRDDMSRFGCCAAGGVLVAAGAVVIAALAWRAQAAQDERLAWVRMHKDSSHEARLDIERITGQVAIEPGRRLTIRVQVAAKAPATTALNELRFSLNPAMRVKSVQADGALLPHSHVNGLLTVKPAAPIAPAQRVVVSIHAQGIPDPRFGYLDSATDAMSETLLGSPMVLLGEQASLFDANYVALTPSVRWLPAAGANFAAPADFHELALDVELPAGWHAAGAGRMQREERLRFQPRVPVPEFALIAAPLERRAMTVNGVACELLIHPKHMRNVDYFDTRAENGPNENDESGEATAGETRVVAADHNSGEDRSQRLRPRSSATVNKLHDHLRHWLSGEHAPAYPHDVISLVEVPAQLRRYGGGWLMDTVQALPGVQLMAEHGFPTSRFIEQQRWSGFPEERWRDHLFAKLYHSGAHGIALSAGAAHNLAPFLTQATGEGAAAVNYLLEWLTAWLVRGRREIAPAHWLRVGIFPRMPFLVRVLERAMASASMASRWFQPFPMSLEDDSEKVSFTGFDPASVENGADILIHKGNLIAVAILHLMGAEKTTRFLALMRERHAGDTFTLDDFTQTMIEVDPALAPFLKHLLHESTLPGFVASDARVDRLPDDEAGNPRYQIRIHARNDELAPGIAGISYRTDSSGSLQWSPFAHMPGESSVEIGVVSRRPPLEVRLETYLSLNRRAVRLRLPPVDAETIVDAPPLVGSRPSDWRPPDIGIVVDDLDDGFATVSPPTGWGLRRVDATGDDALPEFDRYDEALPRWHRQADENMVIWGKYRRTLARIVAGKGKGKAVFTTSLPAAGRWRLYYHLPDASLSHDHHMSSRSWWKSANAFGDMDIKIIGKDGENDAKEVEVPFDAASAVPGWNSLGTYALSAGRVQVVVSDATTGDIVVADAVRWQRLEGA